MNDQRPPADEPIASGDETVVVSRAEESSDGPAADATIVVPRASVPDDATVVVSRAEQPPEDATVVVARVVQPPEDATVVVPRRELREPAPSAPDRQVSGDETEIVSRRPGPDFGPVADPEPQGALPGTQSLQARTVYAARSAERQTTLGSAAVGEHIGQPPEAAYIADAAFARQQLPSVVRRSQRRRVLTLAGYAATLVVSVAGLVAVINMAIGGA